MTRLNSEPRTAVPAASSTLVSAETAFSTSTMMSSSLLLDVTKTAGRVKSSTTSQNSCASSADDGRSSHSAQSSAASMTSCAALKTAEQLLSAAQRCEERDELANAFGYFAAAADKGSAQAQFRAGNILLHGTHGQTVDAAKALQLLNKAAMNGHELAMLQLGKCCYLNNNSDVNLEIAEQWYAMVASVGSREGVELQSFVRDQMAAVKMTQNSNRAVQEVQVACEICDPAEKALKDAREQIRRAAEASYQQAMVEDEHENYLYAVPLLCKAAEQGHVDALWHLGEYCWNGRGGLAKDERAAVEWYRKAAEQGHAESQNIMGLCYEFELGGLVKNEYVAVEWYRKAALQGHAAAQHNMGLFCYFGQGELIKDTNEAIEWFRKAAEQGHALAKRNFEECSK